MSTGESQMVVVRVEKSDISTDIIGAIKRRLEHEQQSCDVVEISSDGRDISNLVASARSAARGVVETAKKHPNTLLSVHVTYSIFPIFEAASNREVTAFIVATMGPVSPLRLHIRALPGALVSKRVMDVLAALEISIVEEIPDRKIARWPEGVTYENLVAEVVFEILFDRAHMFQEKQKAMDTAIKSFGGGSTTLQ